MALGPAEVHPQEHLGPVRGLRAAGAGGDRDDRVLGVVVAREEEEGPFPLERPADLVRLLLEVGLGLGIGRLLEEGDELLEIVGALLEAAPERYLVAQALGFAEDGLGRPLVLPEVRLGPTGIERREALFLGPEVKDAPRSTGSAPRGP
jgi:hypothetical protein